MSISVPNLTETKESKTLVFSWSISDNDDKEKAKNAKMMTERLAKKRSKIVIYEKTRLGCFYVTAILSWGWGWVDVDIETEADLRLGLMLGWDDVESKFSWN